MGLEDTHKPTDDGAPPVPGNFTTITPFVITPHCHAPSCIRYLLFLTFVQHQCEYANIFFILVCRQELWNADTGEILCNMTAAYGQVRGSATSYLSSLTQVTTPLMTLMFCRDKECLMRRATLPYFPVFLVTSPVCNSHSGLNHLLSQFYCVLLTFSTSLTPETNLTAIKYFNNTYRHLGQMAQWTGLMVYDTDPY